MLLLILLLRVDIFQGKDANLSKVEFDAIVKTLIDSFNMLPWLWLKAPGRKLTCITNDKHSLRSNYR